MVVFVCEDSPEGIFTGVYDAWSSRLGHENVRLEVQGEYNYSLFSEYREVAVDQLKAQKVVRSVRRSLSELAYSWIYRTALSERMIGRGGLPVSGLWIWRRGSRETYHGQFTDTGGAGSLSDQPRGCPMKRICR